MYGVAPKASVDFNNHSFNIFGELQSFFHSRGQVDSAILVHDRDLFQVKCAGDFRPAIQPGYYQGGCSGVCQDSFIGDKGN